MLKQLPKLWIVTPCYNDAEVIQITAPLFVAKLEELIEKGKIHSESKVLIVDDGSTDNSWDVISSLAKEYSRISGIRQSRNRGHQNNLLAGLMEAKDYADITISIDDDGQDDINAMDEMVEEYLNGCEIVYGVRDNRDSDTWMKRNTAQLYYKLLNKLGAQVVYNHADYRLVSSRVLKHFAQFEEVNLYLRGMFPLVGFKSTAVYYKRNERLAGKSHYNFSRMLSLAWDGITSLTIKPIHIISAIGMLISFIGFIGIIWAIVVTLTGNGATGWGSTICIILFLGGIQLLSLGVIGEYVGKTYLETKHRPRFIISERTEEKEIEK